jgi:hypothetical protein
LARKRKVESLNLSNILPVHAFPHELHEQLKVHSRYSVPYRLRMIVYDSVFFYVEDHADFEEANEELTTI